MEEVFRKSRWAYLHWYLLVLITIGSCIGVYFVSRSLLTFAGLCIPLLIVLSIELSRVYEKATLGEKEIHYEKGIISRHQSKVQYRSISNISVRQGVFQRIMGHGDVLIDTPGGDGYEIMLFSFSSAPRIEKLIQQRMHAEHARK